MKNRTNILLCCLLALCTGLFCACDETMGGDSTLGFPTEIIVEDAVPGDTVLVPFNVGYNWRITSDKDWCRVDGDYKSTSGKPGKHVVAFVIGEPNNLFADDEALITMRMNDEDCVIARITCVATKEYEVKVNAEDKEYSQGESIVIGTSGELVLNLTPNFNIEQLGYKFPTWLEMERVDKMVTLSVKSDSLKYIINNDCDSLCLFKDTTYYSSFHMQYVGMDPRSITVKGQLEAQLLVSRDAKRAYVNEKSLEMPVPFTVAALNDEYQVMSLGYDNINGYSILSNKEKWFELTDDRRGNITLSVTEENEGKDRAVTLLAFPKAVADSLADVDVEGVVDFLYEEVDGVMELSAGTKQYLLAMVTQYGSTSIAIEPEAQWGLKVAVDGKTYTTSTLSDTLDAPLKATITTDNGYQLLYVNYANDNGCEIVSEADSWLKVTDDKQGNIEVRFERNEGNMRTAYLLALPLAIAEDEEKLPLELFVETEGRMEIRDDAVKYVVAQFIQDAEEESSMKVIDAHGGWKYLSVKNETDDKWLKIAEEKGISPKKVFRTELVNGTSYVLNALISKEIWAPGDVGRNDRIEVYSESGHKYTQGKIQSGDDYEAEPYEDKELEGDYILLQFNTSYDIPLDECYIIYFVTADDVYLKALVVWNYWPEGE